MLSLEGKQLGNYDVVRRIRVGGMGAVYEGRQRTAFGRRVAIKVILGDYAADPDMRRRFAREARTVARLHHPHILSLIEFGDEEGVLYLVMPFVDGGTLTNYLRQGLLELPEITDMYLQLLDAVEHAHEEGLVHRDIKSSNVLLEMRRSGSPHAYLSDFGLVRPAQKPDSDQVGKPIPLDQVPGTPHYMAPEQTRGIVTTLTDIYALGVLLYQMLTGELPYDDPDEVKVIQMHMHAPIPRPSRRDASLPPDLDYVVQHAMAKYAEERYQSVAELREAFLAAIHNPGLVIEESEAEEEALFASEMTLPDVEPISEPQALELLPPPLPQAPLPQPLHLPEPLTMPRRPQAPRPQASEALVSRPPLPEPVRSRAPQPPQAPRRPGPTPQRQVRQTPPVRRRSRRKRLNRPLLIAMLIPALLLILLLLPRTLNVSLFPSGFPLFGTSPVASISVTAQSKTLQDTYLLTASPQAPNPDVTTRTIPARSLLSQSTGANTTQTTGQQAQVGTRARGTLLFVNQSGASARIASHTIFVSNAGVSVYLLQGVTVPPHQENTDGTAEAPASAVTPGVAGDVPALGFTTICCGGRVQVSNPAPFVGGADGSHVHIVSQDDINRVKQGLSDGLEQQALHQLQSQMNPNETLAGQPSYKFHTTSDLPIGATADVVHVTVVVTATVSVYNRDAARALASQVLTRQAQQTLGKGYQIQQDTLSIGTPQVTQQGNQGVVYLSVPVHGVWAYQITNQQIANWQQNIRGSAYSVAMTYLKAQPGIASVQLHLPFGTDHLPTSIDQIQVVVTN